MSVRMETKELRERRGKIFAELKEMIGRVHKEDRGLNPEEKTKFDKLEDDDKELRERIEQLDKMAIRQLEMDQRQDEVDRSDHAAKRAGLPTSIQYRQAFCTWAMPPQFRTDKHIEVAEMCGIDLRSNTLQMQFSRVVPKSHADVDDFYLQRATTLINVSNTATLGSNAVQNEAMRAIESALLAFGGVREAARVIRTQTGANLPIPTDNDAANSAVIVGQGATIDVSGIEFGQTTLGAFKYSSQIVKASLEFMQDLSFDFGAWIGGRLGERIARGTNTDFTIGVSSSGEPAGVATQAIAPTTNLQASSTFANLVEFTHQLDPAYRRQPGTRFMFHDSVLRRIKKMTDANGQPIFLPSIREGDPERILGFPYTINQDMATDSTTATTKQLLFGDFNQYIVRDVMDLTLKRLDERFADQGVVAFVTLSRHDGVTVIPSTATPPIIAARPAT